MKKLFLMGRSEAGKTSLIQALRGEELHYEKLNTLSRTGTQSILLVNTLSQNTSVSGLPASLLRLMS